MAYMATISAVCGWSEQPCNPVPHQELFSSAAAMEDGSTRVMTSWDMEVATHSAAQLTSRSLHSTPACFSNPAPREDRPDACFVLSMLAVVQVSGQVEQGAAMLSEDVTAKGYALLCVANPTSDCKIKTITEVGVTVRMTEPAICASRRVTLAPTGWCGLSFFGFC